MPAMAMHFTWSRESKLKSGYQSQRLSRYTASDNLISIYEIHPHFSLAFSVTLFCSEALIAILVLMVRRSKSVGGGELGGPVLVKYWTGATLIGLWIIYLVMSSLEAYGVIKGF